MDRNNVNILTVSLVDAFNRTWAEIVTLVRERGLEAGDW